ncbi:MAG TPA: diguanylate cyclase [Candidatus Limnocylindrales bacterium]
MDASTVAITSGLAIALVGALAGTAGFSALVVRRQLRHITKLAGRLATASGDAELVSTDASRIQDPQLRHAFEQLAERVATTWQLATIDPLTGVPNRQIVLGRVDEEIARAARYKRPLALVMLDLDHFKRLNDTFGHVAGDFALQQVAQRLAENVRSVDAVGRFGGEEFLLVLPETDADAAATLAEKLRRAVARTPIRLPDGHEVTVTVSAGVAGGPGELLRSDTLVRDADAALYSAKALGRNTVYVFRESTDDATVRRSPIRPEARSAAVDVGRAAMAAAQDALLAALEGRPGWAGKPSTMIAETAIAMARAIELPSGELERIRTASLLHDLGKLAIPDEILAKPADLQPSEWRVVNEHPKIGHVVLEQAGALRDAGMIVLHHHEWFDGRGYPYGLAGADIPIGARIVSICDAYEAMVGGRPYRAAISHEAAIVELRRMAGIQFDPELVEVFAEQFPTGVPWAPESHQHPALRAVDAPEARGRRAAATTAQLHDAVHAARRRAG